MTCIVGVTDGKTVTMGGDAAGSDGWCTREMKDSKVIRRGDFLIGWAGSFRFAQLLQYDWEVPPAVPKTRAELSTFMRTTVVASVRKLFNDHGWMEKKHEREDSHSQALLGVRGRLFELQSDLSVLEYRKNWAAIGSGYLVAHGALFATRGMEPLHRVRVALEAASDTITSVRPPFSILALDRAA